MTGDLGFLARIQEGLRGVVRLPGGTAHSLEADDFPIPVMGKTGTTSDFRDALFVGSTFGPEGITVAVRIGYDDNRELGDKETGGRTALPVFRQVMLKVYGEGLFGPPPPFPEAIEEHIDDYLDGRARSLIAQSERGHETSAPEAVADVEVLPTFAGGAAVLAAMKRVEDNAKATGPDESRIIEDGNGAPSRTTGGTEPRGRRPKGE